MTRVWIAVAVLAALVSMGCSTTVYEFDDDRGSAFPRGEVHEVDVFDGARAIDHGLRAMGR